MKKLISYSAISLFTLSVYSCRGSEEAIGLPHSENLQEAHIMYPIYGETQDTVRDPDPPIRDGQDWRIRNTKK